MMEVVIVKLPCSLEGTEVVVMKLPYPLKMTEVPVAELLAKYQEMIVAELLVGVASAWSIGDDISV
jgi:hypothetical protein